jgi:dTDP-4-dehydrorhamnose reductase
MKVLVTGAKGQLGRDVVTAFTNIHADCLGAGKRELDITDERQTKTWITGHRPDVVVHCAAYTAVDRAEEDRDNCRAVNVLGTRYVAQACAATAAKMIYISTDYVFDGKGERPFEVDDQPSPLNYYGTTKYDGELEVRKLLSNYFIVRISWVFGAGGNNFVKTMLRLGKEKEQLSVVADQIGSPTYTADLARLIVDMAHTDRYGIYHATNEGYCSWYEFAREIFKLNGLDVVVKPIPTTEYPTKAVRPHNSRLSKRSLDEGGFARLPAWQDALKRYLLQLEKETAG